MKLFVIGIGAFVVGYFIASHKPVNSEITYNDHGVKTVVTTCDKEQSCLISVGQNCEDTGYKVVKTDHDDMKTIITAECGKQKELFSFGK